MEGMEELGGGVEELKSFSACMTWSSGVGLLLGGLNIWSTVSGYTEWPFSDDIRLRSLHLG